MISEKVLKVLNELGIEHKEFEEKGAKIGRAHV